MTSLRRAIARGFSAAAWAAGGGLCFASAVFFWAASSGAEAVFPAVALYALGGLSGGAGLLLAGLLLWKARLEVERDGLRRGLDVLRSERETLVDRLHLLERSVSGLTVIREIHAAGNIPGREQRLRALLEALADASGAFRIGLFRFAGEAVKPVGFFEQVDRCRVFVYVEGDSDPWELNAMEVTGVKASDTGRGKEVSASLVFAGTEVAKVEIDLAGRTRKTPPRLVLHCLKKMRPRYDGVAELPERPAGRVETGSGNSPHVIVQPLWAEDRLLGGLRVEIKRDALSEEGLKAAAAVLSEAALHAALALKKEEHREKALRDGLTGLLQKRVFLERLEAFSAGRGRRPSAGPALIMIDIDHFKRVNDTFGHRAGDEVLKGVAGIIRRSLRDEDEGFRYGGEELAVIVRTADPERAAAIAERLRKQVEETDFRAPSGERIPVTVSLGVALGEPGLGPEDLVERADQALYRSKRGGRNRVSMWPLPAKKRRKAG